VSGRTGKVFRAPKRDRHGDPINLDGSPVELMDEEGNAFIGTLTDIIMGGQSASRSKLMQETADTSGMLGCRRDLEPKLQLGDRVVIDGIKYEVASTPAQGWDHDHPFTGTNFNRYWVDVKARVD
jgi:hypothetical protein